MALVALATLAKPTMCTVAAPTFQVCVHPRQPQNHIVVAQAGCPAAAANSMGERLYMPVLHEGHRPPFRLGHGEPCGPAAFIRAAAFGGNTLPLTRTLPSIVMLTPLFSISAVSW